jgi:TraX protein
MFQRIRSNADKYGQCVNSHDLFKCAALLLMTCDHIGLFFDEPQLWWRVVGRWCVPIWFFFAGYAKPSCHKTELYWLAGIMVLADFALASPIFPLNILVTVMAARWVICHMAKNDKDAFILIAFTLACIVFYPVTFALFEYGTQVFLFTLAGYYCRTMPRHWLGGATLAIGCALFVPIQANAFGMTHLQTAIMAIGLVIVCIALFRFSYKEYAVLPNAPLSFMIRLLGRNTQYYYTFHFILFLAIQKMIAPSIPWKLTWFPF